jgi:hypothetical protein
MRFPYDDENNHADDEETGSETNSDSDSESALEQICLDEDQYDNLEKTHGSYYIGSIFQARNHAILGIAIKPRTFYQYNINSVQQYLYEYSCYKYTQKTIEIIQLNILPDLTYACILKTHWLRLVQLHWKKTFAKRMAILEKRRTLESIHYFELHGKYMDGLGVLSSIRGMMQSYYREPAV